MGLILDSSILIAAERKGLDAQEVMQWLSGRGIDGESALSVITVMELEHGRARANTDSRRLLRELFLRNLIQLLPVQQVTVEIALHAGRLDAEMTARGTRIAIPDLLIGVTALHLGYSVVTLNVRHFAMIPGLEIVTL